MLHGRTWTRVCAAVAEGSSGSSEKSKHQLESVKRETMRRKKNTDELFAMHVRMYERHRLAQSKVCGLRVVATVRQRAVH